MALKFEPKKIVEEAVKKGLEEMKAKYNKDILKIAAKYGERPVIRFKSTGKNTFQAHFEVESDELKNEIDEYLERSR